MNKHETFHTQMTMIYQDRLGTNTGIICTSPLGRFFRTHRVQVVIKHHHRNLAATWRKSHLFLESSLCLSRACRGKMIILRIK
eukprot:COSAG06_NODE_1790_length_8394_cov_34.639301_1_plen_83_part_00